MREAPPQPLDASLEVLATQDSVVVWVQVGRVRVGEEGKMLGEFLSFFFIFFEWVDIYLLLLMIGIVMFAIKSFLQLSVHQYEVLPPDKFVPSSGSGLVSFVQFGAVSLPLFIHPSLSLSLSPSNSVPSYDSIFFLSFTETNSLMCLGRDGTQGYC